MGKLVTFVVAVAFQSVIPWIVALVKKKPMTKKGFRILSVIFGLLPVGSTHEALIEANVSNSLATIVAFFCGVCVFAASYFVGIYILRRRNRLADEL